MRMLKVYHLQLVVKDICGSLYSDKAARSRNAGSLYIFNSSIIVATSTVHFWRGEDAKPLKEFLSKSFISSVNRPACEDRRKKSSGRGPVLQEASV